MCWLDTQCIIYDGTKMANTILYITYRHFLYKCKSGISWRWEVVHSNHVNIHFFNCIDHSHHIITHYNQKTHSCLCICITVSISISSRNFGSPYEDDNVENEWCFPRTVNISNADFTSKLLVKLLYGHMRIIYRWTEFNFNIYISVNISRVGDHIYFPINWNVSFIFSRDKEIAWRNVRLLNYFKGVWMLPMWYFNLETELLVPQTLWNYLNLVTCCVLLNSYFEFISRWCTRSYVTLCQASWQSSIM